MSTASSSSAPGAPRRVGFFGPFGTFTEQALLTQDDFQECERLPFRTVPDVLDAVTSGEVDLGFVPIENSIEGMVNFTLDALAFDHDLVIQREVVLDIHLCLLARPDTDLESVSEVHSIGVATAQCHRFLSARLSDAEIVAAASTAAAAKHVASAAGKLAAIAPRVAAERYGLDVLVENIEDHDGNQTRFVVVARDGVPAPTGHDRTALVVYQRADEPGSLISILQEFAARRLNLSNLVSRPIKAGGLGAYCFILFAEGHLADDLMTDAMKALRIKQGGVKFFGSWPRADADPTGTTAELAEQWREADDWVAGLQAGIVDRGRSNGQRTA